MAWSRYRKTLAAVVLGLVELAGYIVADPRDLPPWVVTTALAVNAAAVYVVRNQLPPVAAPTLFARSSEQERRARRGWQPEEPNPRPDPPPFDPDPDLIDHLEGNKRERDRYRAEAEKLRERPDPPPRPVE